jgi:hypothetical protein
MNRAATKRARRDVGAFARVLLACAALSACGKSTQATDGAAGDTTGGASVAGTLTLPATAQGAGYFVRLAIGVSTVTAPVAETTGTTTGTTSLAYEIRDVPSGTYFLLGFVDVDASGGTASTPGDYAGWYGHNGDGNPPAAANVVVPDTGTVRYDFALVLR